MSHDRRTRRVLLAMTGLIGVAMSVGCMRASNLRTAAASLPELSPPGELPADARGRTATADPPRMPPELRPDAGGPAASRSHEAPESSGVPGANPIPAPPATRDDGASGAPSDGGGSTTPPAGELPDVPSTSPTPLLDAEIRRARAVTRQHFESINASPSSQPVEPITPSSSRSEPAEDVEPDPGGGGIDLDRLLPPLASATRVGGEAPPARPATAIALPPLTPIDEAGGGSSPAAPLPRATGAEAAPSPPRMQATAALATDNEPDESAAAPGQPSRPVVAELASLRPAVEPYPSRRQSLEITALQLCSRVKGFGRFEAIDPDRLRPGHRVRVYWEMAGLEYTARGDLFVSRLAAHLELRSEADGSVAFEQSPPTAEDVCPRRRRDYYASTVIELPATLEPGRYRLRLTQTDLVGNRTGSREIAVSVVR